MGSQKSYVAPYRRSLHINNDLSGFLGFQLSATCSQEFECNVIISSNVSKDFNHTRMSQLPGIDVPLFHVFSGKDVFFCYCVTLYFHVMFS